ncbi:MAG: DNA polymerase III subunit alpha [Planctomycetota bacterium]|nr:DNA polymerase III subunit alpha [Planctomycetota bacterium]
MAQVSDQFCHLHVHSHYSLLDGVSTIPALVRMAKDQGMQALALTDHGNMYGAVEFHNACRAEGIKPIIGIEAYITDGSRHERKREKGKQHAFHLVLLAENEVGYHNLLKLTSSAYTEGFYYKPRIDHEILRQHSEGIIATSACLSGEINRALLHGDSEKAEVCARRYIDIFAPGRFFMEVQDHGLVEQKRILERAPELAKKLGIPVIATNDVHYLRREDSHAQEVHLCINTGKQMDDEDRLAFDSDSFYFRSGKEMAKVFGDYPEYITNTMDVASMIDFKLETGKTFLPVFIEESDKEANRTEDHSTPEALLKKNEGRFFELVEEGFSSRYPEATEEARQRLAYEISVIVEMGFVSYFLITWDFCRYAREEGIPVGPGRGSAVGSIVSYCLGITNLCPLKYDLIFERFLNSDRVSMPDIDIDFCMEGREKVIQYVQKKYGKDRVCQIITFGTMAAKAVIRDVGRALGIPLSDVDQLAKKVPDTLGIKLAEALEREPQLAAAAKDPRFQELFDVGMRLEGLNRHCSTHAAGVVIADRPLTDLIPLSTNGDDIVTQYPMETLEQLGLLKMDFLGLRYLTIIDRACRLIEEQGQTVDIENIPLDDEASYQLLCKGETHGIFQLESSGMRELLRNLVPDCFEDLIAVLALYRPGPLGSGMHTLYCDRKHGREKVEYLHPSLKPILHMTNGVILYQEQVMKIAHDLAGFSMNDADSLRKAMGKKKIELMEKYTDQFISGSQEKSDIPPKISKAIFEQIEQFARYGFNKSHSTAYALISYRTAYLKANHADAFLAAVMSCYISAVDQMITYLDECKRMGIEVLPPHVNQSSKNYSLMDGKIVYGLVALKGVGEKAIEAIIHQREKKGPFKNLFDLTSRVEPELVNKMVLEQLISAGAFDELGQSRAILHAAVKDAIEEGKRVHAERRAGQLSLFAANSEPAVQEQWPDVPPWSDGETLTREKASLGFYLSGHPLERIEAELEPLRTHLISQLTTKQDRKMVTLATMVSKIRKRQTKRGEAMAILTIEDRTGSIEAVVFPKTFKTTSEMIETDQVLIIQGVAEISDEQEGGRGSSQIRVNRILPLEKASEQVARQIGIQFPANIDEAILFQTKEILQRHPGKLPVTLIFDQHGPDSWRIPCGNGLLASATQELIEELRELLGPESIRLEITQPVETA